MPNACIALFFQDTVYLVKEKDGFWNFPGGKIEPGETLLQGAFREFQEETGNEKGFNLFNLERWASRSGNTFTPYNVYHSNGVGPPHTTIFYCICKSKPEFTFTRNNETDDGNWFSVYNLPQPLRHRSISELTSIVISNPVHMDRGVDVSGFIGFTDASALSASASAPPVSDDDEDVKEAIRLSLLQHMPPPPPYHAMPPPPSYHDIGQYSVLKLVKRGGTIKNKNKGGKGRKKNKMRKNIKSLKKYKKNKKNIK
jgi:8-oxo-dGTP pyrophosphatase MutT (NUDIX family)